jgi:hypothetical protein
MALNHADPVTLEGPLQAPGMHWTWLTGFRFLIAELEAVGDPDGDVDAGSGRGLGVLHVGSTACRGLPSAGTISCGNPNRNHVRLSGFDSERDVVVIDVGAIFAQSDLSVESVCHSEGDACAPMFEALGVDPVTGEALAEQRVFRVEPAASGD